MTVSSVCLANCQKRYCAVLTRITVDVPMTRVKFNANAEYAYLQNFKVLQSKSLFLIAYERYKSTEGH